MKKYLMMALVALTIASCSKSETETGIEKTYADDDFVMTERNFKEKLIGTWNLDEVQYLGYKGWVKKSTAELGDVATLRVKADGSGELLGLEGVKWRVCKDTIVVSSTVLKGTDNKGYSFEPLGTLWPYGSSRQHAEEMLKQIWGNDAKITIEQTEYLRGRIIKMEKDYFDIRYITCKSPSWSFEETRCLLRRK